MILKINQCLFCGSLNFSPSGFCKYCFRYFIENEYKVPSPSHIKNHNYILTWVKDKTAPVDLLINELKLNPKSLIFKYWSNLMVVNILQLKLNNPCLVPAAAKRTGDNDHAFMLAAHISQNLGIPIYNCLARLNKTEAKQLSKRQRKSDICFYSNGLMHTGDIIFIDDVLTTGTTALKSIEALRGKNKVYIVTLAYRLSL